MNVELPEIPIETVDEWQRVINLTAQFAQVPAGMIMRTEHPNHTVLVASQTDGNPFEAGQSFEFNDALYCYGVIEKDGEVVIEDATRDPDWADNKGLEKHGMSFYIGYPLKWPGGVLFGTICILDQQRNEQALLFRKAVQAFASVIESNLQLLVLIAERKRIEANLQRSNDQLAERTRELEEANTALRFLLSTIEKAQSDHDKEILHQINTLVIPHFTKLARLLDEGSAGHEYLRLAETNLKLLTTKLSSRMANKLEHLTRTEAEVAQLIMRGKTTKEIAWTLSRENSTINFHRKNIRTKLGMQRGQNLRAYLLSIG